MDIEDPAPRWYWDVEERRRDVMLDGKLFLITNVPDLDARDAVRRYTGFADKEKGCPFSAEYVLEKLKAVQHHGFRPATGVSSEESP